MRCWCFWTTTRSWSSSGRNEVLKLGQRLKVRLPGFVFLAEALGAGLDEGRTLAELQLLLLSCHGRPLLGYFIPNSAATCVTRFDASLRVIRRVSCRKRIAFSFCPVRTSPYNCISHLESTPGAAGFSHSTRTFPSGMPQVRIRRRSSG